MGMPGHVIRNDRDTGESWIFTGQGILAIAEVAEEGESAFAPGRVWRSTRARLGLAIEDEIYRLHVAAKKDATE